MSSITDGLFAGRAGIQSHGAAIAVVADNIANSNTLAFKTTRAEFSDLMAGSIAGQGSSAVSIGSGSNVASTTQLFNQGSFELTGRGLDLGIDGNGFFVVKDPSGAKFYTRAGNFVLNAEGRLMTQDGALVMGFPLGGSGGLEDLNVNKVVQNTVQTTAVDIVGNLNADSTAVAVPGAGATFTQLSEAASFSTFVDVFDSLGAKHTATAFFFKTAANTWTANAYIDEGDVTPANAGNPLLIGTTTNLAFDGDGSLSATATSTFTSNLITWANQSQPQQINFSFGSFTQFSSSSNTSAITQDGEGAGSVVSFSVDESGNLYALFDNGQSSSIGTLALATFLSPEGLRRVGNSNYIATAASGEAVIGTPDTGRFGALKAGALELSNSDIANDFIKLISLQRGFQGSSRIITSIDKLLNEIINLAS